jgi:hypothetical protein
MANGDPDQKNIFCIPSVVWVTLAGFAAVLIVWGGATWKWSSSADVTIIVSVVTGLVGTQVGVFFGIQLGAMACESADRARRDAEAARTRAELRALRLAGSTEPLRAESILTDSGL